MKQALSKIAAAFVVAAAIGAVGTSAPSDVSATHSHGVHGGGTTVQPADTGWGL